MTPPSLPRHTPSWLVPLSIAVLVPTALLVLFSMLPSAEKAPVESGPRPDHGCFVLMPGEKATRDGGFTVIAGEIENRCDRAFTYVQANFKLYNESGSVVGSALANQGGLGPRQRWSFRASGFTASYRYELESISGF